MGILIGSVFIKDSNIFEVNSGEEKFVLIKLDAILIQQLMVNKDHQLIFQIFISRTTDTKKMEHQFIFTITAFIATIQPFQIVHQLAKVAFTSILMKLLAHQSDLNILNSLAVKLIMVTQFMYIQKKIFLTIF